MISDIHSHIILGVDDGSANIRESLQLLEMLKNQGVCRAVATPHFYADSCPSPSVHAESMRLELEKLSEAAKMAGHENPKLFLGHEVHYFRGISAVRDIEKLCYFGSRRILLELPFGQFDRRVTDEAVEMSLNFGLTPVLAHIERYARSGSFQNVLEIIDDGFCEAQLNCDTVIDRRTRKFALQLIEDGYIKYLASDAHSVKSRPPRFDSAVKIIDQKLGESAVQRLADNSDKLVGELTAF